RDRYASIEVFPNPVVETLFLREVPTRGSLNIYDGQGRILTQLSTGPHAIDVDMSAYAKGWYGIELMASNGEVVWQTRVLKQ
ncbi:MAG: T9SS type A sorting domain-containing protein, partial [Bacteroidota bacterium]